MASLFARRKRRSPVSACRTSLDKWSAVWLLFLTTFLPLVVVVAAAQGQDGSDSSVIQLQHGQAHVLSAGQDETVRFVYPVHDDAKHVYCAMSGADETGDADLYVRWSQPVDFDDAEMNAVSIVSFSLSRVLRDETFMPHTFLIYPRYLVSLSSCHTKNQPNSALPGLAAATKFVPNWVPLLLVIMYCTWALPPIAPLTT